MLRYGLKVAVEAKVLADVNGTSGIQSQTYATSVLTTLRKGITKLEVAGYSPAAFALHPTDFEDVALALSAQNAIEHLGLPYNPANRQLYGVPVVTANAQAAGPDTYSPATQSLWTPTRAVSTCNGRRMLPPTRLARTSCLRGAKVVMRQRIQPAGCGVAGPHRVKTRPSGRVAYSLSARPRVDQDLTARVALSLHRVRRGDRVAACAAPAGHIRSAQHRLRAAAPAESARCRESPDRQHIHSPHSGIRCGTKDLQNDWRRSISS